MLSKRKVYINGNKKVSIYVIYLFKNWCIMWLYSNEKGNKDMINSKLKKKIVKGMVVMSVLTMLFTAGGVNSIDGVETCGMLAATEKVER